MTFDSGRGARGFEDGRRLESTERGFFGFAAQEGFAQPRPSGNASLPDCFFPGSLRDGDDGGLAPIPLPEGFHPSDSLLRFALD